MRAQYDIPADELEQMRQTVIVGTGYESVPADVQQQDDTTAPVGWGYYGKGVHSAPPDIFKDRAPEGHSAVIEKRREEIAEEIAALVGVLRLRKDADYEESIEGQKARDSEIKDVDRDYHEFVSRAPGAQPDYGVKPLRWRGQVLSGLNR